MHRSIFEYIAIAKLLALVAAIGFFLINPLAAIIAFLGFMAVKYLLLELFHRFLMPLAILATVLIVPIYVLVHSIGSVGHVNTTPFLIGGAAILAVLAGIATGRAFLDHNREYPKPPKPINETRGSLKPHDTRPPNEPLEPASAQEIPATPAPTPETPPKGEPAAQEFPAATVPPTKCRATGERHVTSPSHSPARKFVAHHVTSQAGHSHAAKRGIIEDELKRRLPGDNDAVVARRVPCDRKTVQAHRLRIGFEYEEES